MRTKQTHVGFVVLMSYCAALLLGAAARADFLVASDLTDQVLQFSDDGAPLGVFVGAGSGGLNSPRALAWGPDGNLYVAGVDHINVYDGSSGAFLKTVQERINGQFFGLAFTPAGELLASVSPLNAVQRISLGTRAVTASIPVGYTPGKMIFLPNGELLVGNGSGIGNTLKKIDLSNNHVSDFASGGGLDGPFGFDYGPNGLLYTGNLYGDHGVYRIHPLTGQVLGKFADSGLGAVADVMFASDNRLWVASPLSSTLRQLDATTGQFISSAPGGSNNFDLLYIPEPTILPVLAVMVVGLWRHRSY